MSMFGDSNYHKNSLYDAVKEFYENGGTTRDLFDVLSTAYEFQDTPESILQERINKAIEELEKSVTFCENDSQGAHDICNIAIAREKRIIEILRGE